MPSPILKALPLLLALLISGSVLARGHAAPEPRPAAALSAAPVPLAARFELQVDGRKTDWYLWREADSVETAYAGSGYGEIWQRMGEHGYGYRRIFHPDRKVVEYTAGELKARHAEPDWSKLESVLSPQVLERLRRAGSKPMFGQRAVRYLGRLGGEDIDLWWLETARLPARLSRSAPGQRMTMVLKALGAQSPAAWPRADEARIADYGLIDAADIGDMESDPFVARLLYRDGHHHGHD